MFEKKFDKPLAGVAVFDFAPSERDERRLTEGDQVVVCLCVCVWVCVCVCVCGVVLCCVCVCLFLCLFFFGVVERGCVRWCWVVVTDYGVWVW